MYSFPMKGDKNTMTLTEKEEMFFKYRTAADEVAYKFSLKYNRSPEETKDHTDFALAVLIFQGLSYDPSKSSLRNWIKVKVYWYLQEIYHSGKYPHCSGIQERRGNDEIPCSDILPLWEDGEVSPPASLSAKPNWIQNLIIEAGEEAQALLQILRDAPDDLIKGICPAQGRVNVTKQNNLRTYLIDTLDWPWEKVDRAFEGIQSCLT